MADSVTPILSVNRSVLTDPVDQIAYLIRHAYYNPGWTSNFMENRLISMRKLFAECSNDLTEMATKLKQKLDFSLGEMFNGRYHVAMSIETVNEYTKQVTIGVVDSTGRTILTSKDIRMVNGEIYLKGDDNADE